MCLVYYVGGYVTGNILFRLGAHCVSFDARLNSRKIKIFRTVNKSQCVHVPANRQLDLNCPKLHVAARRLKWDLFYYLAAAIIFCRTVRVRAR